MAPAGATAHTQAHRAADQLARSPAPIAPVSGVAQHHEGGVALAGQAREAHHDAARKRARAVEHDQPERPAAQEDVGAPRAMGDGEGRVGVVPGRLLHVGIRCR